MNTQNPAAPPLGGPLGDTPGAEPAVTMTREEIDALVDTKVAAKLQEVVDAIPEVELDSGRLVRFAVYDTVELKFVGGVVDDKTAARAIAREKGLKTGSYEIREV